MKRKPGYEDPRAFNHVCDQEPDPGSPSQGTPATLVQAIENGMESTGDLNPPYRLHAIEIKAHVRDYLAQRFSAAMFRSKSGEEDSRLKALFKEIVSVEDPEGL